MPTWLLVLIIILGVVVVLILAFGVYTAAVTTHPRRTTMESAWNNEMSKDYVKRCDMNPASVYTITTDENYVLPVQSFAEADDLTESFIWIMNHEQEIRRHLEDIMPGYIARTGDLKELFYDLR